MSDKPEKQDVRIVGSVHIEPALPTPPDIPKPAAFGGEASKEIVISAPTGDAKADVERYGLGLGPLGGDAHLVLGWQNFYLQYLSDLGVHHKLEGVLLQAKSFSDIKAIARPRGANFFVAVDKSITIKHVLTQLSEYMSVVLSPDLARVVNLDDFFVSDRIPAMGPYGVWMREGIEYASFDCGLKGLSYDDLLKRHVKCLGLLEHLLTILYLRVSSAWGEISETLDNETLCAGSTTRRPILLTKDAPVFKGRNPQFMQHADRRLWVPWVHFTPDRLDISIISPNDNRGTAREIATSFPDDFVQRNVVA